ncbi:hypothetical protein PaG_04637 [Moesziomyces aphidis]|uniref:Peptidase M20 dimerisation domain-containing protein n=1 Tax=Moesziomyces aphidis TaxID=84754 RepID=W3VGH2_MOEAP|nr:hypothetical protein PaG_04637 [Moesziomyces aphidis]
MGAASEAQLGLPPLRRPSFFERHARLLKCILAFQCALTFVLLHIAGYPLITSLSHNRLSAKAAPSLSHTLGASGGNDACPQVPPFELPSSNGSTNGDIDLPSDMDLARLLSGAVQVDTSVGDDWPTVQQDPARWEAVFAPLHAYLRSAFPLVHAPDSRVRLEKVNEWGLVYTLPGTNESLPPLVLMAHQDVVPVEPETVGAWTHAPFSGFIDHDHGLVWGRGASDCKASLVSILATLESVLRSGYQAQRTVVASFGFDEESSGTQGGEKLAAFLETRYGKDGVALIVDEGGSIELGLGMAVAAPTVAEKGYLDVRVTVHTPGGHSSAPRKHTSIGMLAQLITAIESDPYEPVLDVTHTDKVHPGLQYLQCTRDAPKADAKLSAALKKLAVLQRKHTKRAKRKVQKQADKVLGLMSRNQRFGFQTTQAVDLVAGGVKINALPEQASAVINHRIDITSSTAAVREHVHAVLRPVADRLGLSVEGNGSAWSTVAGASKGHAEGRVVLSDAFESALEPAPYTPLDGAPWKLLQGTIRAVWPGILVAPDVMGGNTDTKSYWNLTRHVFRFSPGSDRPFPIKGGDENIHTVDEATPIHALVKATQFYTLLIQAVGTTDL